MPGERLLNDNGAWSEVTAVTFAAEPLTAYNITVNEFHTYFVAANTNAAPVWVHNNCPDGPGAPSATALDDIIARGQRLPSTGGRSVQIQKAGGFSQANVDLDALGLSNVREIKMPNGRTGRVGEFPDGTRVVVRPTSSDRNVIHTSQPTLEVQSRDGYIKIRY
ncbi:polymorphic toxin-type HINT domain-containing protein [Paracoccus sp. (in: a-proteobacteria)]|uniref:polymorphic toxin-type HINT domain-containing protein n=1 Tax=Paracoccus sp. TaxID=267 RepID=UPI0034CFC762